MRRRAITVAAAVLIALAGAASRADATPAWPRYAQREGLSCTACHVANEGGPLTELGRRYRWRQSSGDDHMNGGGDETSSTSQEAAAARPKWGRWTGEASVFGRFGRTSVLGEPERMSSVVETLRLHGDGLFGDDQITFDGEGYARQGFNTYDGGLDDDDAGLATAQIAWRSASTGAYTRLGRQYVVAGAATRRVDGLDVRTPLGKRFDVEIFGGVPSDNGFGGAGGDLIFGGRVGANLGGDFSIGASGFYAKDEADPSDGKGGLDAHWSPIRHVDIYGQVFYDWIADRIYDAGVHATWQPAFGWQLAADWKHAVPALFLPKNSIYWVFSVDAYDETGLVLTRRFDESLSTSIYGRYTKYESNEHLDQVGASIDARYGPNGEDTVGGEVAYQNEARDNLGGSSTDGDALFLRGYHSLRWTEAIYTAIDASIQLVTKSSGRDPTLLRLVAGYDPQRSWDVELGVDWRRNLDFEDEVEGFARLRIRF